METTAYINAVLIGVVVTAAITDVRDYRIPNWLTFPAMVGGLLLHTLVSGKTGLLMSLGGAAIGLGLYLIPYGLGWTGAGDVKLMATIGSFLGPWGLLQASLVIGLVGGLYALFFMAEQWGVRTTLRRLKSMALSFVLLGNRAAAPVSSEAQPQLRYGLVIALGTVLTQWYQAAQ